VSGWCLAECECECKGEALNENACSKQRMEQKQKRKAQSPCESKPKKACESRKSINSKRKTEVKMAKTFVIPMQVVSRNEEVFKGDHKD